MYAQYVKNTMQPLNIADVTKDQHFPWTVCISFSFFVSSFFLLLFYFPLHLLRLSCYASVTSLWQGEDPDHTSNQIKSLLCSPIRNGKKDKVIGGISLSFLLPGEAPFEVLNLISSWQQLSCNRIWFKPEGYVTSPPSPTSFNGVESWARQNIKVA